MSFLFDSGYYEVGKNGVSPFQNMHFHLCPIETRVGERRYVLCRCAYLGGSAIQTVGDNPVTAYRQTTFSAPGFRHRGDTYASKLYARNLVLGLKCARMATFGLPLKVPGFN